MGPCGGVAVGKYLVLQLLCCHAERDDLDHFRARRVLQSELIMAPSVAFPLLVGWFERLCHVFLCVIFGHLKVKKKKRKETGGSSLVQMQHNCSSDSGSCWSRWESALLKAAVESFDLFGFSASVSGSGTPPAVRNLWILGLSSSPMSLSLRLAAGRGRDEVN